MIVIETARSFVGTPFIHGARLPGIGLDCIGVGVCAAQECGFHIVDVAAYPLRPDGTLKGYLDDQMVKVTAPQPGDVLLMIFEGMRAPHHISIYTGRTIIHAHMKARKCVEQDHTQWWIDRTVGIYRFKELA